VRAPTGQTRASPATGDAARSLGRPARFAWNEQRVRHFRHGCSLVEAVVTNAPGQGSQRLLTDTTGRAGSPSRPPAWPPVVRCKAGATTDKAGGVPMQACRQPLACHYHRSALDGRIRSSAAAITRVDPGHPDAAIAIAGHRGQRGPKRSLRYPREAVRLDANRPLWPDEFNGYLHRQRQLYAPCPGFPQIRAYHVSAGNGAETRSRNLRGRASRAPLSD